VAVLVGDFGTIGTVGLEAMLESQGLNLETSTVAEEDLLAKVSAGTTEVVVLDSGIPHALETAARITAEHTDVRVIVCSLDDTTMMVFSGQGAAPYEAPLDPPRLAAAVREGG
jgi:DNA-binding NarL/FixJ family response regulator